MISVTKLQVRSYDLDHLDIFWEIPGVDENLEAYDFFVLRSIDGAAGPYETLAGPFYNTFMFRDVDVHSFHKWRKYFYKIRIVHRSTQEQKEFGPEWHRAEPDLIALEIQRRERLLFKELAGREVFLFPALTFGQRCSNCWDSGPKGNTIGRSTQQNCQSCFDTTWVGGFASPMLIDMQIDPSPETVQRTDVSEEQFVHTTARTSSFPPIKAKDMIVEAENKRWLVKSMTPTQKLRAVVRQELQMFELARDDIKFKTPVNYDLLAQHSPQKAFTRFMSLQSEQHETVPDLFGEER